MRISDWSSDVCSSDLAASPAEAKSSRLRPRGSGTGPGRSAVGLQVAGLEALLEPVEGAHARQREVPLAAAIDQHAAVERVDNAYQLGLEAVLARFATPPRGDVLRHHGRLQVGLVRLLGHPLPTGIAAGVPGPLTVLHAPPT